jgi:hypothetical protein
MYSNRDCFLSTKCVYVGVAGSIPQKFLLYNNAGHVKTRSFKTVCIDKWILSSESSFYLEFIA